jgi:2',3'-cyclic-nucleotide 2'-phosphodiesterase (5'-nucleotidase family)
MTTAPLRLSIWIAAIFITSCAGKNDIQVKKAAPAPAHRMVRTEGVEEVPLPMINDADVILPANMTVNNVTVNNATEVQEDNENEEDIVDHLATAENSTTSSEEPMPNATLPPLPSNSSLEATSSPSSSPTIEQNITESPIIKLSTNAPSLSPSTSSPSAKSTTPIDVSLNIQSINIVILTDVHSWVQGHGRHEPNLNADYGHILSFYQRLQQQVEQLESKPDIYLVNNGDFLHGTLLGDDPPEHLVGILERIPFDAVTVGEHELISPKSVERLREPGGLFDEWGERLVTSNVRQNNGADNDKVEPLGNNYLLLQGNQGSVLVLGFLYNLNDNESAAGLTVADVQDVIQEGWFTSLFASCKHQPQFDAIMVLSHMDVRDELITLLLSEFRKLCGEDMVVQFITGHTHIRSFVELDSHSSSIEAGRFLDTVGFVSFEPKIGSFEHNFIPANEKCLAQSLNMTVDQYPTRDGKELSEYIARTLDHAGANQVLGCASKRFNEAELLDMYLNEVMPTSFLNRYHSSNNILIQYLELIVGYDLFPGVVTMGDIYTVMPQDYDIVGLGMVTGSDVTRIMKEMNKDDRRFLGNSTNIVGLSMENESGGSTQIESSLRYGLYTLSKDASQIISIMNDLGVKSSVKVVSKDKTVRGMWIDYVLKQMPYDGNDCKCINDINGCSSSGYVGKAPSTSQHTSPQPQPTQPTSNHGSTVSAPGVHNNTSGSKGGSLGKSHSSGSNLSSNKASASSSSSWTWMFVVIAGGVIYFMVRSGRRAAARPEFGNDLEMTVSPPPSYGYGSGGGGAYDSPHLGRYV